MFVGLPIGAGQGENHVDLMAVLLEASEVTPNTAASIG
jgi:hypothetical protein